MIFVLSRDIFFIILVYKKYLSLPTINDKLVGLLIIKWDNHEK